MQGLFRRGGVWWARLVIPERLRVRAGRREFVRSTRRHDLVGAKLIHAQLMAAWRMELCELEGVKQVRDSDLRLLLGGSPALAMSEHVSLLAARNSTGLSIEALLNESVGAQLDLMCRLPRAAAHGHVGTFDEWVELGEKALPRAEPGLAGRVVRLCSILGDSPAEILASGEASVSIREFDLCDGRLLFADDSVRVAVTRLVVPAAQVEAIRVRWAAAVSPDRHAALEGRRSPPEAPRADVDCGWAAKPLSEALKAYCELPTGLRATNVDDVAIRQRLAGMRVLIEFEGDQRLGRITGDMLRRFRDGPLRTLPANANSLPSRLRRATVRETIAALEAERPEYERMSAGAQAKRMAWLGQFFRWLSEKGHLRPNPAAALAGESTDDKATRKSRALLSAAKADDERGDEEGRREFTGDELRQIFELPQFSGGNGLHVSGNRQCLPFEYWLPLLGLYAGLRIKEAAQLYLNDIRLDESAGHWYLDINEGTADKTLKNQQSIRKVPVHPELLRLGLVGYRDRLRAAGWQRLFPELTCAHAPARYAKEPGRKMSRMFLELGWPRDGSLTFHSFRHCVNNGLARLKAGVLDMAEDTPLRVARCRIMGHDVPLDLQDVNTRSYLDTRLSELMKLIEALEYESLPSIAPIDADWAIQAIRECLDGKRGRKGDEDLGDYWREKHLARLGVKRV